MFRLYLRLVFAPRASVADESQVPLSDAQLQLFVMLHADDGDA